MLPTVLSSTARGSSVLTSRRFGAGLAACFLALAGVGAWSAAEARADDWWPHGADASWTYSWSDSAYSPIPTVERVTVSQGADAAQFTLAWTTSDLGNPDGAVASEGAVSFASTPAGIESTDWTSSPPPPAFPILCAQSAGCGNSLASTLYLVIWGSRSPVLAEPLLSQATWASTGGVDSDVTSNDTYLGRETIRVPAFPEPVEAAKVRSDISQAGARGDPYGSGVRTVWWVYGVGPVKVEFQHAGGADAPVTTSTLQATSLVPKPAPSDANYFPLVEGQTTRYSWTNKKHLPKPSVQTVTVQQVVNGSARIVDSSVSGPIKVAASYGFTERLDGLTNIWGQAQAATIAKLPPLGPRSLPKTQRRHFLTPMDLLTYGFNPILPAYPAPGASWNSHRPSRDFSIYGVLGSTKILGTRRVRVPAGTFDALVVRSRMRQPGFPWGSGTRTAWFAPGRGLVKLVFRHGDHSRSVVVALK